MTQASAGDMFAALYAAHLVGDHWAQTSRQAAWKGREGWEGRRACAVHIATLTACKAAAVTALHLSGQQVRPVRTALALAGDAVSHYLADRRSLDPARGLARLAELAGLRDFWKLGAPRPGQDDNPVLGTGAYALDQAFHVGCLWAASVAAAR